MQDRSKLEVVCCQMREVVVCFVASGQIGMGGELQREQETDAGSNWKWAQKESTFAQTREHVRAPHE